MSRITKNDATLMQKLFFRERICALGPETMREGQALAVATG